MRDKITLTASFLTFVWQRFNADNCRQNAAALTYMSLFAVVPLMTVLFTVISSIPAFQGLENQLQNFIFEHLVPTSGSDVKDYLVQFIQQTRNLSIIGVGFLAVTAFLMLKNIEKAFNHIWHIERHRHGVNGLLLYWAVLSLGPFLLGATFAIQTYLVSLSVFFDSADVTGIGTSVLGRLPFIMSVATFTLLFVAIPNCKVPFRHALYGGVITATCFALAKTLFTTLISNSSYEVVYGAFAAIPLLLLWLHLSWQLLLGGAELVYAFSHFSSDSSRKKMEALLLLQLLEWLLSCHQKGETLDQETLMKKPWYDGHKITAAEWEHLQAVAVRHKLAMLTEDGSLILGRDLQQLPLWQILEWAPINHNAAPIPISGKHAEQPHWLDSFQQLLHDTQQQSRDTLQIKVAKLLEKTQATVTQ